VEATQKTARRTGKVLYLALAATVFLVAADVLTKAWVIENLSAEILMPRTLEVCERDSMGRMEPGRRATEPYVIIPGLFELRYAENCGAAFGIMRNWPKPLKSSIFFVVALGALVVLGSLFFRGRGGPFLAAAVPLILAGAIGNLIDRIRLGFVVDFLRFYGEMPEAMRTSPEVPPYWEYPTFNVADIAISVGVVCLLIDSFTEGRRERKLAEAQAAREEASSVEHSPEAT
jgi:signal peptidase II